MSFARDPLSMWKTSFATILVVLFLISSPTSVISGPVEDGITALDRGQFPVAYQAFRKGAEAGNAEAQVQLATMLIDALGVRRNYGAAAKWLRAAAERGHRYAMYRLGRLYEDGLIGEPDIAQAVQWYTKGVRRREPNAAFRLATLYEQGRGVGPDRERALKLYRLAAAGSVLKATHRLGSALVRDNARPADMVEGAMWLELALRGGDVDVIDELKNIRVALTPAQRAAVRSRVRTHLRKAAHH